MTNRLMLCKRNIHSAAAWNELEPAAGSRDYSRFTRLLWKFKGVSAPSTQLNSEVISRCASGWYNIYIYIILFLFISHLAINTILQLNSRTVFKYKGHVSVLLITESTLGHWGHANQSILSQFSVMTTQKWKWVFWNGWIITVQHVFRLRRIFNTVTEKRDKTRLEGLLDLMCY